MSTYSNCNNSLSVGDIIKFGNYFINDDKNKEPIEWRVLEVSNNKALLVTKDAIDGKPYNTEWEDITWEQCSLRQWLNNEFINQAFSKKEQEEILLTNLSNPDNFEYRTIGGNNTQDKIFLLSIDEVKKYFKDYKDRECKVTHYAKQQGAWSCELEDEDDDDEYVGNCYWWLRSPGSYQNCVAVVFGDGIIHYYGLSVNNIDNAVRPALFINWDAQNSHTASEQRE